LLWLSFRSTLSRMTLAESPRCRPVIWRRGSFGTDSEVGNRYVERIGTVVATLQAQHRDVFAYLVDAHVAFAAGQPVPSMLPIAPYPR